MAEFVYRLPKYFMQRTYFIYGYTLRIYIHVNNLVKYSFFVIKTTQEVGTYIGCNDNVRKIKLIKT